MQTTQISTEYLVAYQVLLDAPTLIDSSLLIINVKLKLGEGGYVRYDTFIVR